jgi:uncharacterized protein with ParB-like and HNH nuclease domain
MPAYTKLTNSSDEATVSSLLSGNVVFSIPYFQRAYKWKTNRIDQLNKDLIAIVDGENDLHFFGAVIIHGRRSNPSDPTIYEVIDGQQRITTIYLFICALIKSLCKANQYEEAATLFLTYLAMNKPSKLVSNFKLHPCKEDRHQFNDILKDVLNDAKFTQELGSFVPKYLPDTGSSTGTMTANYKVLLQFLKKEQSEQNTERIRSIYTKLFESLSVVQIDVWNPANGPKIFDSLNSRQEPMTIGDLVRNEVFSRVANREPDEIEAIDAFSWRPFYDKFQVESKNYFDSYFFPYGLTQNSELKKSQVYSELRDSWKQFETPEEIIDNLSIYQDAFLDLMCGTNIQNLDPEVFKAFHRYTLFGAPTSITSFIIQLSYHCKMSYVSKEETIECLELIESFLVRRALCGHEPTGLHAVFKNLWTECNAKPNATLVDKEIRKHRLVFWPDDATLENSIKQRDLYSAGITKYFLTEYDISTGGDLPNKEPWIEHVLPQSYDDKWLLKFDRETAKKYVHTLANLIPLSEEMNRNLSNSPYEIKRQKYSSDSMYKSARMFATDYDDWTSVELLNRANVLSNWAKTRWKY